MTYSPDKPPLPETADELRARIPGWGADLDHAHRPSVPKLDFRLEQTGARWRFPDRQPSDGRRERSIEHESLTPVFGTSCPRRGLSGAIRGVAYRRYSEARAAHWLLLILADRVDAWTHHLWSFATARPDNPLTETGVRSELGHRPISARFGRGRADPAHQWWDPLVVAGPWLAAGGGLVAIGRRIARRRGSAELSGRPTARGRRTLGARSR